MIADRLEELKRHAPVVITIGASAGAVETLLEVLPSLRVDCPASIVMVVHIPPDRDSALPELFARTCPLTVQEAEDKQPLSPATVYLAPPGYHLLVDPGGVLSLSTDEPVNFSRPSIDVLFESVAHAYGSKALGILLTGGNVDGAAGLACIRLRGGLTWVQSPDSARVRAMPDSALAMAPHPTLVPRDMARTLAQWQTL